MARTDGRVRAAFPASYGIARGRESGRGRRPLPYRPATIPGMKATLAAFVLVPVAAFAWTRAGDPPLGYRDTPLLPGTNWHVHDDQRPAPRVVTPGDGTAAPSDARVLFDGRDLSHWRSGDK